MRSLCPVVGILAVLIAGCSGDDTAATTDPSGPGSSGCGQASTLAAGTWVSQDITVGGSARQYFVRLPTGYEATRRYPIVYELHGCSSAADRQSNNVPIENESGEAAILVRGRADGQCWDTAANGPDIPYIDAMIPAVESQLCVDTGRRFAAGYSSGSFMTHVLGCTRGALLRGVASIAGGQSGSNCTGDVAALLIHDADDTTVNISASISARDGYLTRNGCDANAARSPFDPSPCESYAGCAPALPVVWCQTSGQGHSRQDGLAAPAFWHFFSGLAAR